MTKKAFLKVFAAFLVFAFCASLLAGCAEETVDNSSAAESTNSSESTSSSATFSTNSEASTDNSGDASDISTESGESSVDNSETSTDTSDEIIGQGSKDEPYMEIPTADLTVTTASVPAGKSLFYGIYRVGGTILTIESDSVYVICDGTRYESKKGKVSFTVPDALASTPVMFEIGNSGSEAKSFVIKFANPTGSQMNPTVVKSLGDKVKIELKEGNSTGYYYKYVAEKSGTIRFYIEASTDSIMVATNNRNSAQRTSEDDSIEDGYFELVVEAGDEIIINVGAKPTKRGKYPATTITWYGKYA